MPGTEAILHDVSTLTLLAGLRHRVIHGLAGNWAPVHRAVSPRGVTSVNTYI